MHILPELELLLDDELLLDEALDELDAPSLAASVGAAASGAGRPVVGTGWAAPCTVVSPPLPAVPTAHASNVAQVATMTIEIRRTGGAGPRVALFTGASYPSAGRAATGPSRC